VVHANIGLNIGLCQRFSSRKCKERGLRENTGSRGKQPLKQMVMVKVDLCSTLSQSL